VSAIVFDVSKVDALWDEIDIDMPALAQRAAAALPAHVPPNDVQEISLVLMDNDGIAALNRDYRSKDKPTNVLSFPTVNAPGLLGDIVLASGVIMAEAQGAGKRLEDHLTHLIIHGTLHLLGYDHIDAAKAEAMEAIEIQALAKLGIANPYVLTA